MNRCIGAWRRFVSVPAFRKYAFLAAAAVAFPALAAQPQKLLVFDYKLDADWIAAHGSEYVFVWGASTGATLKTFEQYAPRTVLSKYFPYSRDPDAKHDIAFWKRFHPDWIQYECDGKTPATLYGGANVSLDISNPEVRQWQLHNFLALPKNIHEVALDNYQFDTHSRACGHVGAKGFVARYTGTRDDHVFAQDAVVWLEKVAEGLHAQNVRVIINHTPDLTSSGDDPSSPLVKRVVASVDGILDEGAARALGSKEQAAMLARLVSYVTGQDKRFYFVYRLRRLDDDAVESAMANYLTMANALTAVYVNSLSDTYGSEPPNFLGYDKAIGEPCGPATSKGALSWRRYSQGMVAFVMPGAAAQAVPVAAGYRDRKDQPLIAPFELKGGQGRVLYRQQADGCGTGAP